MQISEQSIRDNIPYYLTSEQKAGLLKALNDFPHNINYYFSGYENDVLQGDGWKELKIVSFKTGQKESIRGIVLSNSCDVSSENKRDIPMNITFAPIIPLSEYRKLLELSGIDPETVKQKISTIIQQKVTNIFYLPAGSNLEQEYLALFGDIHSMPTKAFDEDKNKMKLFTLSQIGFYLFIFKLSIHFCRFHENIARI
jgi:hypothetical protein